MATEPRAVRSGGGFSSRGPWTLQQGSAFLHSVLLALVRGGTIKNKNSRAGEMAQPLIAAAVLVEDLTSAPSTPHRNSEPSVTPVPGIGCPLLSSVGTRHAWGPHIHKQATAHAHKMTRNTIVKGINPESRRRGFLVSGIHGRPLFNTEHCGSRPHHFNSSVLKELPFMQGLSPQW